MKKINIFLGLFALVFSFSANAQQVMLKAPDMNVEPGANIHLDIQVENFSEIVNAQFSINWDKNVLQFLNVDNFGLPDLSLDGNFGTTEIGEGKLRFAWYQQELSGVTLADMSTIFSVWFKVVGDPNESTQVMISNDPLTIEVGNVDGGLPYVVENGTITVNGTTATTETQTQDFVLFQNSPNPFTELTNISFNLNRQSEVVLSIYDQTGRVIFQKNQLFPAGLNKIPVSRDLFQGAGTYFYTIKTERATATRQLIVQ